MTCVEMVVSLSISVLARNGPRRSSQKRQEFSECLYPSLYTNTYFLYANCRQPVLQWPVCSPFVAVPTALTFNLTKEYNILLTLTVLSIATASLNTKV